MVMTSRVKLGWVTIEELEAQAAAEAEAAAAEAEEAGAAG
jgi:N utilization substance protein A